MALTARLTFQKALRILGLGRMAEGERLLNDALNLATQEGNTNLAGRTLCCLSELLYELGKTDEAESFATRFGAVKREDDVLDEEAARVEKILLDARIRLYLGLG